MHGTEQPGDVISARPLGWRRAAAVLLVVTAAVVGGMGAASVAQVSYTFSLSTTSGAPGTPVTATSTTPCPATPATVELYWGGVAPGNLLATTTADGSGNWSATFNVPPGASGSVLIYAICKDPASGTPMVTYQCPTFNVTGGATTTTSTSTSSSTSTSVSTSTTSGGPSTTTTTAGGSAAPNVNVEVYAVDLGLKLPAIENHTPCFDALKGIFRRDWCTEKFLETLITPIGPAPHYGLDIPLESVSLDFSKIEINYKLEKNSPPKPKPKHGGRGAPDSVFLVAVTTDSSGDAHVRGPLPPNLDPADYHLVVSGISLTGEPISMSLAIEVPAGPATPVSGPVGFTG